MSKYLMCLNLACTNLEFVLFYPSQSAMIMINFDQSCLRVLFTLITASLFWHNETYVIPYIYTYNYLFSLAGASRLVSYKCYVGNDQSDCRDHSRKCQGILVATSFCMITTKQENSQKNQIKKQCTAHSEICFIVTNCLHLTTDHECGTKSLLSDWQLKYKS